MNGLGLTGQPTIYALSYLKANIEGGEKFNWFYDDSNNNGIGLDPNGSDLRVSLPEGDRLTQSRSPYFPNQQLLANKQLRWWWNNPHQVIYDAGDGNGWGPHGPATEWVAQSKSIIFAEYGYPACDRGTNQPNVFYAPASVESFTPYWSIWDPVAGDTYCHAAMMSCNFSRYRRSMNIGLSMEITRHRPPASQCCNRRSVRFGTGMRVHSRHSPARSEIWGDADNWQAGQWLNGKGPFLSRRYPIRRRRQVSCRPSRL